MRPDEEKLGSMVYLISILAFMLGWVEYPNLIAVSGLAALVAVYLLGWRALVAILAMLGFFLFLMQFALFLHGG